MTTSTRLLKKDLVTMQEAMDSVKPLTAVEVGRCYARHEDALAIEKKAKSWK